MTITETLFANYVDSEPFMAVVHRDVPDWNVHVEGRDSKPFAFHLAVRSDVKSSGGAEPYTLTITATRTRKGTKDIRRSTTMYLTGLIKRGQNIRVRLDAVLEEIWRERQADGQKHEYCVQIRVRSGINKKYHNQLVGTTFLTIGKDAEEIVSREVFSLYSRYFDILFNGRFSEAETSRPIAMHPLVSEDKAAYEEGMSLLIEYVSRLSLAQLTMRNIFFLIELLGRFEFYSSAYRRIDRRLREIVLITTEERELDEAMLLAEQYEFVKTTGAVIRQYKTVDRLSSMMERIGDQLSRETILRVFRFYSSRVRDSNFSRCSHLCFEFPLGRVIVQLNRIGLPRLIPRVLNNFIGCAYGDRPAFYYEEGKRRYRSAVAVERAILTGEQASKSTVPSDAWALVLRYHNDGQYKYFLTRDRPTDSIYLGFVVEGRKFINGERCLDTSLYHLGQDY